VAAQAAHSAEEYFGRLWETLLPASVVSRVFSSNPARGFLIANLVIVAFGVWCALWPIRRRWRIADLLMWGWVAVETANGVLHPVVSLILQRYVPGTVTAPVLLLLAIRLGRRLRTP
jgi:hypothetical protein